MTGPALPTVARVATPRVPRPGEQQGGPRGTDYFPLRSGAAGPAELAGVPVPQRVPRSVALLVELTAAVVPLHSLKKTPLVHRDLKPANVLRDSAGRLRITDLGLGGSAIETERSLESQGGYHRVTGRLPTQLQGSYSLHYASKQQRAGLPTTTQDDVFSLGVIAYQMLTGKLDTGPGTDADDELRELGVPDELVKVVKACASDEPKRRPANAMALGERLAALAPPSAPSSPPAAASSRRPEGATPTAVAATPVGRRDDVADLLPAPATAVPPPPPAPVVRKAGDRHEITLPGGVPMAFAWCPPGTFLMGSSSSEHGDYMIQHPVTLTKGFYMGVHPVTQAQYRAVMGTNPSHFKGDTLPVEQVSWEDAVAFCTAVKAKTGVEVRLPTEAEWEYAARGGTATPFYWGDELNGTQANCVGTSPYGTATKGPFLKKTMTVGSYAAAFPHPWGLADVIGNVWEWCSDWYRFIPTGAVVDPLGTGSGWQRVIRGGSWNHLAMNCRASYRLKHSPVEWSNNLGFRLATVPSGQ